MSFYFEDAEFHGGSQAGNPSAASLQAAAARFDRHPRGALRFLESCKTWLRSAPKRLRQSISKSSERTKRKLFFWPR